MGRFIVFVIFLFLGIFGLFGQTRTFYEHGHEIEHYTLQDGLQSNHVGGIIQSKDGYLWFATQNGFIRYDGIAFKTYTLNKELITYTTKDHLSQIFEDRDKTIWITTLGGGIIKYNPQENTFKRFETNNRPNDYISQIVQDSVGNFWYGSIASINQLTQDDSIIIHKIKTIEHELNPILDSIENKSPFKTSITDIDKGATVNQSFEISENKTIAIIHFGRADENKKLLDYGWIENDKGEKIWTPDVKLSVNAGGSFRFYRANIDFIELKSGSYKLVYNRENGDSPNLYKEYLIEDHTAKRPKWQGMRLVEVDKLMQNQLQMVTSDFHSKEGLDGIDNIVFKDLEGNIWYVNSSLGKVDIEKEKIFSQFSICGFLDNDASCPFEFSAMADKDRNNLWLGGIKKIGPQEYQPYLGVYNKKSNKIREVKTGIPKMNLPVFNSKFFVPTELKMDYLGNLWIGTISQGLFKLSPPFYYAEEEGQPNISHFKFALPKEDNALLGNPKNIYSAYVDKNNNLWVGTQNGGLYKVDLKPSHLQIYDLNQLKKEGRFLNSLEDNNDQVWIGTTKNGLIQLDLNNGNHLVHDGIFKGFPFDQPIAPILKLPDNRILFQSKKQFIVYNATADKIDTIMPSLFRELTPQYFSGVMINDSLAFLSYRSIINVENWKIFKRFDNFLNGSYFRSSFNSKDGFWVSSHYGDIAKFSIKEQGLDTLLRFDNETIIYGILEDEKGSCWISSNYGLQEFIEGRPIPITYNEVDNEIKRLAGSLQTDNQGNIWVFTLFGVYKFDVEKRKLVKIDGLSMIDSPGPSYSWKSKEGAFRVLGAKKLFSFHPDSLSIDKIAPKVLIRGLRFQNGNKQIELNNIQHKSSLDFKHTQNDVSLEYIGFNFNNAKQITYAYQLENHQKDWQSVGKDRTARFSNLPPGNYTFKVKAANADGIWSEPKSIKITIHPPWWQTWWAYALYVLAGVGALLWYMRNMNLKLKKEQAHSQELQTLNHELKDINTANQRFVPNDFLQILGKDSIKDLKLGDQTQTQMTVLFSDIRDYTPLSESMTPEENFKFINAYLGRVGPIIKEHGGFISTYLGDGFMALFVNEPENALKASIAAQKELDNYNRERLAEGKRQLKTGMGLNTGDLMLGVIGDEHRYESTVISDAVNTASRMEGLTKIFGAAIILSEKTLMGLNVSDTSKVSDTFAYRYLGKVKVKGKDKAIKIYDLYEGETVAVRQLKAQTKLTFEQGITHYFNREFGKSAECFKQVSAVNESDKAAQYYLDKAVHFIVNGVTEDWSGVEEMVMK